MVMLFYGRKTPEVLTEMIQYFTLGYKINLVMIKRNLKKRTEPGIKANVHAVTIPSCCRFKHFQTLLKRKTSRTRECMGFSPYFPAHNLNKLKTPL